MPKDVSGLDPHRPGSGGPGRGQGRYKPGALTQKEALFCQYYAADPDLNASRAALKAGYTGKHAAITASGMLKKPKIRKRIREILRPMLERVARKMRRTKITNERVLEELAAIAFSDVRNYVKVKDNRLTVTNPDDLSDEAAAAVSGVERTQFGLRVRTHDKLSALSILAKIQRLIGDDSLPPLGDGEMVERIRIYKLPEKRPLQLMEPHEKVIDAQATLLLPTKKRAAPVAPAGVGRNGNSDGGSDDELA